MTEYLKSKQYYIDLYDKHTVETCRRFESNRTVPDVPRGKKVTKKEAEAISNWAHDLMLTFEKGERWLNKSKTISEWMERDRQRDEFLESTNPPEDIRCLTCRNHLKVDSKQLGMETIRSQTESSLFLNVRTSVYHVGHFLMMVKNGDINPIFVLNVMLQQHRR